MAYNFTSHLKTDKYKDIVAYSIRYDVTDKCDSMVRHSPREELPNWYEKQIENLEDDLLNKQNRESTFIQTDDLWEFTRYRNIHQRYGDTFTEGFHSGVVNSRSEFINYALSDINVVPNSLNQTEDHEITAKGMNKESIRVYKKTRGTGNTEELAIIVASENKTVTFSNRSSLYVTKHVFADKPDVMEEKILSRCETHGCVNTPNGLYIFSGDYRKKDEIDDKYYPNFDIKFYNRETLDILMSDAYGKEGKNNFIEELSRQELNPTYIQFLINQSGIQPDETSSMFCTNYDLVTYAKMMYKNPEMFMGKNQEIKEEKQYSM